MITQEEFQKFYSIILGIRRSFDPTFRDRVMGENASLKKKITLEIEGLRLDLMYVRNDDPARQLEVLNETAEQLTALMKIPFFAEYAHQCRLRIYPPEFDRGVVFDELKNAVQNRNATVAEAIAIFTDRLAGVATTTPSGNNGAALRKVIPEQRLAPVKFAIYENRLALARQSMEPDAADTENIQRAREALLQQGGKILTSLEQSNCDRRVLESLRELHEGLAKQDNIIELGIMTIGVDRVCKSAACELPEALSGAIDGHIAGIGITFRNLLNGRDSRKMWQKLSWTLKILKLSATQQALSFDSLRNSQRLPIQMYQRP